MRPAAVIDWCVRAVKAIPIAVRPLLFLAAVPIGVHQMFIRPPQPVPERGVAAAAAASPPTEAQVRQLIEATSEFHEPKQARCFRNASLDPNVNDDVTAPVCRAMVRIGWISVQNRLPTDTMKSEVPDADTSGANSNVTAVIGRRRLRAILKVTAPPQEADATRDATRVDFAWSWEAINSLGVELEIASQQQDMRGTAYFTPDYVGGWRLAQVTFSDATPDYYNYQPSRW